MNHFEISIVKSAIRILGAIICLILLSVDFIGWGVGALAGSFILAEFLGILEEVFDKRKE